ncbi:MAG TPA: hypothetical protein VE992_00175, partial [Solirubrobacteraceae bacterium]|nr:hypothetical protein [Solirubrobacteraceae bacterium]
WTLVLKPHSSSPAPASVPAVVPAPHTAAKPAKHAAAAPLSKAAAKAQAKARAAAAHARLVARREAAASAHRVAVVQRALAADKVVAILFFNPAAADDRADQKVLNTVPTHGGKVVRVAVPVSEISRFPEVVNHVPVQSTPALVVIDAKHRAQQLAGFADQLEYDQLVAAALRTK